MRKKIKSKGKTVQGKRTKQPKRKAEETPKSVPKSAPSGQNHYIDNKRFLKELVIHRKAVSKAKKHGSPLPKASEYIGQCFLDIAMNLAKKSNFANYSYRDEMISDSVENCIMYVTNFDPRKSKNPFAFFTQVVYYAFLRRISKEKKQTYVKMRCFEEKDPSGRFRNWMENEHRRYEDSSRSPYSEFIIAEPSPAPERSRRRRGRKGGEAATLDGVMEEP